MQHKTGDGTAGFMAEGIRAPIDCLHQSLNNADKIWATAAIKKSAGKVRRGEVGIFDIDRLIVRIQQKD